MIRVEETDFRLGAFAASAPEKLPPGACLELANMMLDDEGAARRRGGMRDIADSGSEGVANGTPRMLWDGVLAGGPRTVVACPEGVYRLDGTALVSISTDAVAAISQPAVVAGMLFVPIIQGGAGMILIYGGSEKAVTYSTGTVTVAAGGRTMTGVGTSWLANVDAGMIVRTTAGGNAFGVVESVDSDTQLTLRDPWHGVAVAAGVYQASVIRVEIPQPLIAAAFAGRLIQPFVGTVAGRLLIGLPDGKVFFSKGPDPDTGAPRPLVFEETDFHDPSGGGADLLALATLRDKAFVFTTQGAYAISNMAFEIVAPDGTPQHRVELLSRDVVAIRGGVGIATFRDALVVPAVDDIYLLDGLSAPMPISGSARRDWRSAVKDGKAVGNAAVYRGHYVLPVAAYDGSDLIAETVWCFRLDKPAEVPGFGVVFPWSWWESGVVNDDGHGVTALVVRRADTAGSGDVLLAAANTRFNAGTPYLTVLDATPCFDVGATNARDQNYGGQSVAFDAAVTLRDLRLGGAPAMVRFVRPRYRVSGMAFWTDEDVTVEVARGGDREVTFTSLGGVEDDQDAAPRAWATQLLTQFLRVRIVVGRAEEFVLHSLEVDAMESGRFR